MTNQTIENVEDKTYTKWSEVPSSYHTTTQWNKLGRRVKVNAKPNAFFNSIMHNETWNLYTKSKTTEKRKVAPLVIPDTITLDMVCESLYIINKNAKNLLCRTNKDNDYRLKELVLRKLQEKALIEKIETHFAGPYQYQSRDYVIRSHYDDDGDYNDALRQSEEDDQGRPYIAGEETEVFDIFKCYYIGGYSFHSPIGFHKSSIPDGATKIADDQFVAIRKNVKNIRQARAILKKYIGGETTI